MNKRKAVIAMLAATVGLISKKTTTMADGAEVSNSLSDRNKPQHLTFDLASFAEFDFRFKGESVKLSPAEIFAVLKE